MPARGRLCQASECCARFALHSRPRIGMTERGQIEQTSSIYGQRSFGLGDALLYLCKSGAQLSPQTLEGRLKG
jgi:hypothetical protein